MHVVDVTKHAASNVRKQAVTFEEAATVFDDEHALVLPDLVHEDRLLILGRSARARVLRVNRRQRLCERCPK